MTDTKPGEIQPSWGRRLAGLDGLRGLALLAVVLAHVIILYARPDKNGVEQYTALGTAMTGLLVHGLTFFFVLSGFLLYRPYASAVIKKRPKPPTREYFRNRVLRIWPAYLLILAIVGWGFGLVVVDAGAPLGADDRFGYLTDPLQIVLNALLLQGWVPQTAFTGLGVSWSLVTEVGFYVILPLLGLLGVKLARTGSLLRAALVPGILLLVLGEIGRVSTHLAHGGGDIPFGPTWSAALNRSIIGQADLFGMGMLAAVTVIMSSTAGPVATRRIRVVAWTLIALGVVAVLAIGTGEFATPFMGLIFSAGIVLSQMPRPDAVWRGIVRTMETAPPRLLGEYSLSCYLWHYPVMEFMRRHFDILTYDNDAEIFRGLVIVLVPILVLGTITFHLVEKPMMKRKHRTDRGAAAPAAPS